jgi:hypothetical protein
MPRLEDRMGLIIQMHEDLGHLGEERTLAEVYRRYFWYNRKTYVKMVLKLC